MLLLPLVPVRVAVSVLVLVLVRSRLLPGKPPLLPRPAAARVVRPAPSAANSVVTVEVDGAGLLDTTVAATVAVVVVVAAAMVVVVVIVAVVVVVVVVDVVVVAIAFSVVLVVKLSEGSLQSLSHK